MKKHLRKKKHKGEFNYKGFEISCNFEPELIRDQQDNFLDNFIDFVESVSLGICGGLSPKKMEQFVVKRDESRKVRGELRFKEAHCTEVDRQLVLKWLTARSECKNIKIGPLIGSW